MLPETRNGAGRHGLCAHEVCAVCAGGKPKFPLKKRAGFADKPPMNLRAKFKYLVFTISRRLQGKALPAKRRDLRVVATVEGRDGQIPAVIQNISATGLCFVLEEANLPEEFMIQLNSPQEKTDRRLRCRKVWSTRFDSRGVVYLRVGCAFNEQSHRLRWLGAYLTDEFQPSAGPEAEAA